MQARHFFSLKTIRLALHLALAITLLPTTPMLGQRSAGLIRWWHGRLLRILGISIELDGAEPDVPMLIAANHCSWLDIVVLGHTFNAVFLSKSEIGQWPLIGAFSKASGTLFLARGSGQTAAVSEKIQAALGAGRSVILFPEGTTTKDILPRRFHARLFAAAIDSGTRVLPLGVRYCDRTTPELTHHALAPWVNENGIGPHFSDLFKLRGLTVQLRPCAALDPRGHDRRSLAEASRRAIRYRQTTAACHPAVTALVPPGGSTDSPALD